MDSTPKPDDTIVKINSRLVALATANPNGPYIYPALIRFKDSASKANWIGHHEEVHEMTTIKMFTRTGSDGKPGKIALFNNLPVNWIKAQKAKEPAGSWRDTEFHVWAAAIFTDTGGAKHMILWDCDKHEGRTGWTRELAGPSKKSLKDEVKASYLWVYLGSEYKGQGLCHQYSWEQLERWAHVQDKEVVKPEGGWDELPSRDAKFKDCVLITYK